MAAAGQPVGAREVVAEAGRVGRQPGGLGDSPGQADLVHLLEGAEPLVGELGVAAQQDDRRLGQPGDVGRGQGVGVARPGRHERRAGPLGQAGVGVGHVDGTGLVAGMDELYAGVDERGVERHDLVAGEVEEGLDAGLLEGGGEERCAGLS
jgi:hypothetical protein